MSKISLDVKRNNNLVNGQGLVDFTKPITTGMHLF